MYGRIPAEVKNRLVETLKPAKHPASQPIAPPRPRRIIQRQELLRQFDPYARPQRERSQRESPEQTMKTSCRGFRTQRCTGTGKSVVGVLSDGALSEGWKQT